MKPANLRKIVSYSVLSLMAIVLTTAFKSDARIDFLSLDMKAQTLYQGKSVTTMGTVYYKTEGNVMVTRMTSPVDQLVFTSALGEFKSYDFNANKVILMEGEDYSSKKSFLYQFLNGQTNDMGLKSLRFKMVDTRVEDGLMINTWRAPETAQIQAVEIEVVYRDFLPIYMGFQDQAGNFIQKTYYTNYNDVSFTKVPFTITEISFLSPTDSTITRRSYSNLKLNGDVDKQWFGYNIPSDAAIITTDDVNQIFRSE